MPPLSRLFTNRPHDPPQRKNEPDATYLARTVHANTHSQTFSALTFRFSHSLNLSLRTAEQARMIAAYDYPGAASLYRYSERELSAAAVYMASYVCGEPRGVGEVAGVAGVGAERVRGCYGELYGGVGGMGERDWREVFGGVGRRGVGFPPV
ncbi:hypothetical protein BDR22DRAFT_910421 [Usnea florida]